MLDIYKFLRDKEAIIELSDGGIRFTTTGGETVEFVADNKRTLRVKKNCGNLGTAYNDDNSTLSDSDNSTDFVSGEKYLIYNIQYYPQKRCRRVDSPPDICHELFVEMKAEDGKYCDLLLRADTFSVYINAERHSVMERRIFAGYYKRYDGFPFYVVDVVRDFETKREVIICSYEDGDHAGYFTLTQEEFCAKIDYQGRKIKKYSRNTKRRKISDGNIDVLTDDAYRAPVRHDKNEEKVRARRTAQTYRAYAKDLCDNYDFDLKIYKLCIENKRLIGVSNKTDFTILKEDLMFLHGCLKTTLKDYSAYFQERFAEKKSVRKYGEDHGLNRGSVDYLQKKLITALAKNLEDRDKSDGIIRLNQFN